MNDDVTTRKIIAHVNAHEYEITVYETRADEASVSRDGVEVLYYLHDLGGVHVEAKVTDAQIVAEATAAAAVQFHEA